MDLKTPLVELGPAFRMKKSTLSKLGLETVEDLLFYTPFRYDNNAIISKIGMTQAGELVTIQGHVTKTSNVFTRRKLTIQRITVEDETGEIEAVFFNQRFILTNIHKSDFVSFAGRVEKFGNKKTLSVRSYEVLEDQNSPAIHTTGLVPIYSEKGGLTTKWFRNRIKNLLEQVTFEDYLPDPVRFENKLIELDAAARNIHFPKSIDDAEKAKVRLSFDELLIRHAAATIRKREWQKKQKAIPFEIKKNRTKVAKLIKSLPFELTTAQSKALEDIFKDLEQATSMNRLLEGDVGSGKTVVAAIAGYVAFLNGFQTAFMAPTEILANQHFETIRTILERFGVKVCLFTSNSKIQKIKDHKSSIINHQSFFDVAIGTHALLHGKVKFENLGLVVIDEQQRFGVEQRAILREKGSSPHLLSMTATPIPRTIFLTIYADLSLSHLDELPTGRKKIKTWLVPEEKRESAYQWLAKKNQTEQSQIFIVCPFIEPSETLATVKAARDEFDRLKKDVFPNLKLGLLHGRLDAIEKNRVIEQFRAGSIDILVATPVIEVGIDIPTADIMLVEAAERFGLAQLHQMRGRVGRGEKQSYCLLFTDSKTDKTRERILCLEKINDGAKLAEIDLKLRGPGDMFGTAQHGIPDLQIASLSDIDTVESARKAAEKLLPDLVKYPKLQKKVAETYIPKISRD